MLGWWRRRRAAARLVQQDVTVLIEAFGDGAYHEARRRVRQARAGQVIDHDRPPGHWTKVNIAVARRSGPEVGLDTATRYLQRDRT